MLDMIISSPSSAALQSGACSPSRFSVRSHRESFTHPLSSAPLSHSQPSLSSAVATPPPPTPRGATANIHRTPSRSRLSQGVEEIRAALKRHTVDAATQYSPPEPSGDHPRGSMSARPGSLGGGNCGIETNTNTTTITANNARGSDKESTLSVVPSASSSDSNAKRQLPDGGVGNILAHNNIEAAAGQSLGQAEQTRSKRARPSLPAVKLLPRRYELANTKDLVVLISSMLMELIQYNDEIPLNEGRLTRFHSRTPPRISVRDYLQRLTTHATLSPPILLSMVYYIDRLCALYPAFTVSSLTIHRFLIASSTVASKGLSDSFWTNKTYARVGGISVAELALLELEFLWRVEWKIVPQPEVLVDYYLSLVERCEGYQLESETTTATPNSTETANLPAAPGAYE